MKKFFVKLSHFAEMLNFWTVKLMRVSLSCVQMGSLLLEVTSSTNVKRGNLQIFKKMTANLMGPNCKLIKCNSTRCPSRSVFGSILNKYWIKMCWQPSFPIFYFNDHGFGEGKSCLTNLSTSWISLEGSMIMWIWVRVQTQPTRISEITLNPLLLPKKKEMRERTENSVVLRVE